MKRHQLRRRNPIVSFVSLFVLLATSQLLRAQTADEVQGKVNDFVAQARELYRFDEDKTVLIWDAYCAQLDPSVPGGKEVAGDVGYAFQRDEQGRIEPLLTRLEELKRDAEKLKQTDATASKGQELLDSLNREERILKKLQDGVVLRGSNHPFTQYALAYGIQAHKEYCSKFRDKGEVCDQPFDTISNRRPDLVTVNSIGLVVYEFKPKGQESKALSQAEEYVRGVQEYYQQFFPNGRNGAMKGAPDDKHGGQIILDAIKGSSYAWTDGDTKVKATAKGETYDACEKRY